MEKGKQIAWSSDLSIKVRNLYGDNSQHYIGPKLKKKIHCKMSIYAWEDINWTLVESRIFRLQVRIFKASQKQQQNKVRYLQKKILRSIDAKVLAVRRVAQTNRG